MRRPGHRRQRLYETPLSNPSEPEVADADMPGFIEQKVARFDIAVYDTVGMGMLERLGHFLQQFDGVRHTELLAFEKPIETAAREKSQRMTQA